MRKNRVKDLASTGRTEFVPLLNAATSNAYPVRTNLTRITLQFQ